MADTKIEWAEKTWNPVTGCTPISEGCDNCYAKREAEGRLRGRGGYPEDDPFRVTLRQDRLDQPLRWKKQSRIFVCSMGDLFHEDVPDEFIDQAFSVMLACHIWNNVPGHRILILTKRASRMTEYFSAGPEALLKRWANAGDGWLICNNPDILFSELVYSATCHDWDESGRNSNGSPYKPWGYLDQLWPLPNVFLGVTAENQARANERIPILLQIPAAVRFISVEPMLSAVDLTNIQFDKWTRMNILEGCGITTRPGAMGQSLPNYYCQPLSWVICGSETGPNARPIEEEWVKNLKDQCVAANVPFFYKQKMVNNKKITLPELEGKQWAEFPRTIG